MASTFPTMPSYFGTATQSCLAAKPVASLGLTSQQWVISMLKRLPPNCPLGERMSPQMPQNEYSPTFKAPTRILRLRCVGACGLTGPAKVAAAIDERKERRPGTLIHPLRHPEAFHLGRNGPGRRLSYGV